MAGAISYRSSLKGWWPARIVLLISMLACASASAGQPDCVALAAERYGFPVALIRAILKVEGGSVGQAGDNSNGTQDLGPMQVNTVWLPELASYGITRDQLQSDRCINVLVGSWILSRQFKAATKLEGSDQRRYWWAIGAYHSRTPQRNVEYALKVWRALHAETPGARD